MKLSASDIGETLMAVEDWCTPDCEDCGANDGDKDNVECPVTKVMKTLITAKLDAKT